MRLGLLAAGLAGLLLATALIAWFGSGEVVAAVLAAGWRGIAAISLVHLVSTLLCALAWRLVVPGARRSTAFCCYARWVREAVGNLLGLLPVAGEIVGARLLVIAGVRRVQAAASVVVDLTTETLSQVAFTLLGLALLIAGRSDVSVPWILLILGASIPAASVVFVARSRRALGLVEAAAQGIARSLKIALPRGHPTLAEAVHALFRRRAAIAASMLLHLAAWLVAALEVWLALHFMGRAVTFGDALVIESLMWAIRSAVFIVPSGFGIQEGGYVLIGTLLGLEPEAALALSLVKRGRDLVLGLPALLAWQASEGGRLRRARADADEEHAS
jgi:putative membrane protein